MLTNKITTSEKLYFPVSDRIRDMREEIVHAKAVLDSKRAVLVTASYQETENEPAHYRRAKAFKKILEEMDVIIWPNELIVGNHGTNGRRSAPVFPEWGIHWLERELDERLEARVQDPFVVPEEVKAELKTVFPYWRGRTVYDCYRKVLPEEVRKAREAYIFTRDLFERGGYGHVAYDTPKVLEIGFKGIKEEIRMYMAKLSLVKADDQLKRIFYEAALITIEAIITFANRFSKEALCQAAEEKNPIRKAELERIAETCAWVPEHPARSFTEAVQAAWFLQLVVQIETNGNSVSPGRLDQYFYPYYATDKQKGTLTNAETQEILDCLWLKLNEMIKVWDAEASFVHPGFPMTQTVTIGGQTPEGLDATNELSFLMLNAQEHINLQNPQFTARIHRNSPYEYLLRIGEVIRNGSGMPAVFGDEINIPAMMRHIGVPIERARDYRIVGCIELTPRGFQGRANGGYINGARIVDLALNNGVDRLNGKQIGPQTGDSNEFTRFEQLEEAVKTQMEYFAELLVANNLMVDITQREHTPHVFLSTIVEGCIESGKDLTWGGSLYGMTPNQLVGMATSADSLTAVKKLVFDDERLTMEQLNDALDTNFEGEEGQSIRNLLLKAPKFGNDNDEADLMVRKFTNLYFNTLESFTDVDGRPYCGAIITLGATVPHGWKTAATADGRLATTPTSDSMCPTNGADKNGPTAVLNSAGKIDQIRMPHCNVLNLKFHKNALDGEGLHKFVKLMRTYLVDLKGQELQVNVVNNDTLRDAQKHPERYKDLIVRIAGYSARFVELSPEMQNDLIGRTENDL